MICPVAILIVFDVRMILMPVYIYHQKLNSYLSALINADTLGNHIGCVLCQSEHNLNAGVLLDALVFHTFFKPIPSESNAFTYSVFFCFIGNCKLICCVPCYFFIHSLALIQIDQQACLKNVLYSFTASKRANFQIQNTVLF